MKKLIFVLLTFFSISFAQKENHWFLKGGLVYTTLTPSSDVDPKIGHLVGFGGEAALPYNFLISLEINYLVKGATIEKKPLAPRLYFDNYPDGLRVYNHNIHCYITYLEFPFLLKYKLDLDKSISLRIFTGISYSIPLKDYSRLEKRTYQFTHDPDGDYPYEYGQSIEPKFESYKSGIIYRVGFELLINSFGISLSYGMDSRDEIFCTFVSPIHKNMKNLQLSLTSYF